MALFLKNLLFTIFVPGVVAVLIPLSLTNTSRVQGPVLPLGVVLLGLGAATYLWCLWDFASFGRGTPAPIDAPKRLVVRGLYRYSRNPMYVGVLTTIAGWCVVFGFPPRLLAYFAVVATMFQLFIVLYEEPHLRREFGSEYDQYRSQVKRWLGSARSATR